MDLPDAILYNGKNGTKLSIPAAGRGGSRRKGGLHMKTKRLIGALLVLALALGMGGAAFATDGSTAEEKIFYVTSSYGGAYVTLRASQGVAYVYKAGLSRYYDYEDDYGFFFVQIYGPGRNRMIRWVPSANWAKTIDPYLTYETDTSLTIEFPQAGEYVIMVTPMGQDVINDLWVADRLEGWSSDARWFVSDQGGCTVSDRSPEPPAPIDPVPPVSGGPLPFPRYGYGLSLNNPYADRIRPQCGPGYQYQVFASMNGSTRLYNPREITYLQAHFCDGSWVYVEFGYSDGKTRYGFFEKSLFSPSVSWNSIPSYTLRSFEKTGYVVSDATPCSGPGDSHGQYSSCRLYSGTAVYACMECDGWYLCRFCNDHSNCYGDIYLWVPGYCISWY